MAAWQPQAFLGRGRLRRLVGWLVGSLRPLNRLVGWLVGWSAAFGILGPRASYAVGWLVGWLAVLGPQVHLGASLGPWGSEPPMAPISEGLGLSGPQGLPKGSMWARASLGQCCIWGILGRVGNLGDSGVAQQDAV